MKEREQALQSLDLVYIKYSEITRNLDEGFKVSEWCKGFDIQWLEICKFYNDLAGILMQFKEVCKAWALQRNQEIQWVVYYGAHWPFPKSTTQF